MRQIVLNPQPYNIIKNNELHCTLSLVMVNPNHRYHQASCSEVICMVVLCKVFFVYRPVLQRLENETQ